MRAPDARKRARSQRIANEMIVPAILFSKLLILNNLQKRTLFANSADTSGIEKTRPISEHYCRASVLGNSWRDRRCSVYITPPGYIPRPVPERQAVSMHHEESRDLELLKADIASRLRSACAHFSEREFAELVHQIASIELKYGRNPLTPPMEAR
jgi:hypothetical protein